MGFKIRCKSQIFYTRNHFSDIYKIHQAVWRCFMKSCFLQNMRKPAKKQFYDNKDNKNEQKTFFLSKNFLNLLEQDVSVEFELITPLISPNAKNILIFSSKRSIFSIRKMAREVTAPLFF